MARAGSYARYGVTPIQFAIGEIIAAVITIGLWNMRRWAVIAEIASLIFGVATLLLAGSWGLAAFGFLAWSIYAAILINYYPRMR